MKEQNLIPIEPYVTKPGADKDAPINNLKQGDAVSTYLSYTFRV